MAVRRSTADGLPVYGAHRKDHEEHVFRYVPKPSGGKAAPEDPPAPAKPDPDRIIGKDPHGDEDE